jgi:hypothetical protein
MSAVITLQLKAKHFTDADFLPCGKCPVANAAKEQFNVNLVSEGVDELTLYDYPEINKVSKFSHASYDLYSFESDKMMAEGTDPDVIIRKMILTPIPF